jgi:hypothetical protein
MTGRIAAFVDEARLWARHMSMARHGATPAGGVNRQALSAEDAAAQNELIGWGTTLGLEPATDAAGNLFLRLAGTEADAAPVMTGSHPTASPRAENSTALMASSPRSRPSRPSSRRACARAVRSRSSPG